MFVMESPLTLDKLSISAKIDRSLNKGNQKYMSSTVVTVQFILSAAGTLSVWFTTSDGRHPQFQLGTDHPNHAKVIQKLKEKDYSGLEELCEDPSLKKTAQALLSEAVEKRSAGPLVGTAEIKDGVVFVNHVPVHNVVTERVAALARAGLPVEPALRFLELLLQNPSSKAQEELYDFLANKNLPLTEDGCFLGYKRVREDFKDVYSGTIDNSVGRIVEVPRDAVDDDRSHECSRGLHVGALDYVRHYSHGGHVVVVKVNPMDCVSVPRDHNAQKLRTCRYEVLYEMKDNLAQNEHALTSPLYSDDGTVAKTANDAELSGEYWKNGWSKEAETVKADVERLYEEFSNLSIDDLVVKGRQAGFFETRDQGREEVRNSRSTICKDLVSYELDLSLEEVEAFLDGKNPWVSNDEDWADSTESEWESSSCYEDDWNSSNC